MLQCSEVIPGEGPEVLAHSCRLGLEGIVSKKIGQRLCLWHL
jgi:hypothetical protein